MSLVIEQTREELLAAQKFSRNANVKSIRLLTANISRDPDEITVGEDETLRVEIKFSSASSRIVDESLEAAVAFLCRILKGSVSSEEENIEAVRIECLLVGIYALRPGYKPSELELQSFHKGNAVFNCWPFFREFAQNMIVRMELPAPPIPFLRIHKSSGDSGKHMSTERKLVRSSVSPKTSSKR